MNSKVEQWLTVGALAGWVASMGSLMILAVRAAAPRASLPPLVSPATAQNSKVLPSSKAVSQTETSPFQLQPRSPLEAKMPTQPSNSYWLNSLPQGSQPASPLPHSREPNSRDRNPQ